MLKLENKDLNEIEKELSKNNLYCYSCKRPIRDGHFKMYDHPMGLNIKGYKSKQWVYYQCPYKDCGYQTSYQKFQLQFALHRHKHKSNIILCIYCENPLDDCCCNYCETCNIKYQDGGVCDCHV